jgi:hypothetical protein
MDIKSLAEEIARIEESATRLREMAENFPAVAKNAARILASVRMLQLNVTDVLAVTEAATRGDGVSPADPGQAL